ncbi:MAG TPA: magnesium and cobalt transport protein CorA [Pseudonocardiaceae bacterium]|jgi:magnesium transporter|nr:magnesium and cobalt transport protein CorA [Pseudonocardiaceae bacterium]
MVMMDSAVYHNGRRCEVPGSLESTYELLRVRSAGGSPCLAWIGLYRPDESEITSVAAEFNLHELAVEDAVHAHQRPKLERYGDTLFVVLRPARYVDSTEVVDVGELHVFLGTDFVITIRHADEPDLAEVRTRLEGAPNLLKLGPLAVLYAILDRIVDDYQPVLQGLRNDIDEIEDQVFRGEPGVSRRIYQLSREVIEFQRACEPLLDMLAALFSGFNEHRVDVELQRQLRDVQDHLVHVVERVDALRELLGNILTVNSTMVAQRQNEETTKLTQASLAQNEEVKRISSWAAILFAPSIIGTVYGMNFTHMPELRWRFGYPMAVGLMVLTSALLYLLFRRRGWL